MSYLENNPFRVGEYRAAVPERLRKEIEVLQREAEIVDRVMLHLPQSWRFSQFHVGELYGSCGSLHMDLSGREVKNILAAARNVVESLTPARTVIYRDGCVSFRPYDEAMKMAEKDRARGRDPKIDEVHPVHFHAECTVPSPATGEWVFYARLGSSAGETPLMIRVHIKFQESSLVRAFYTKKYAAGHVYLEEKYYFIHLPKANNASAWFKLGGAGSEHLHSEVLWYPVDTSLDNIFRHET